jgi:hypothetical protein
VTALAQRPPMSAAIRAALDANPDHRVLDDDGEDTGYVNLYTQHWVEVRPGVIDPWAVQWYRHGNCALLAITLHDLTGWPLLLLDADPQGWVHAAVRAPDGRVLDIGGPDGAEDLAGYFRDFAPQLGPLTWRQVDRAGFMAEVGPEDGRDHAAHYSPVEVAVTDDYAGLLAAAAGWNGIP